MGRLCAKIKGWNKLVVMWEKKKKLQSQKEILEIKEILARVYKELLVRVFTIEEKGILLYPEENKEFFLQLEEEY